MLFIANTTFSTEVLDGRSFPFFNSIESFPPKKFHNL
nr:MAG TPA: hypothetical protein [Caudoviricetes sp.]